MNPVLDTPIAKPVPLDHMVLCGAKTRRGTTCKRPASANGKCDLHGGKSLSGPAHPSYKTGHRSKYTYLPPVLTARIEAMNFDLIENLEESVKTQIALETRLNEQFGEGCSLERWAELKAELDWFENAERMYQLSDGEKEIEEPDARDCITRVSDLVKRGLQDARHEEQLADRLRTSHESQRKLSETISKVRKESQEIYTQEQWNVMLNILLNVTRKCIVEGYQKQLSDGVILGNITTELDLYSKKERVLK